MKDWTIVSSKSDRNAEFGIPIGQILCRYKEDVEKVIKERNIKDPVINNYLDQKVSEK